jgi:hypothetical protein
MANFMAKHPGDVALRTGVSIRLFASLGGAVQGGAHNGTSRIPVNGVVWPRSSCLEVDAVLQPGRQPCFVDVVGCHGEHRFDGVIGVGPPVVP